jgi:hypothetical protein
MYSNGESIVDSGFYGRFVNSIVKYLSRIGAPSGGLLMMAFANLGLRPSPPGPSHFKDKLPPGSWLYFLKFYNISRNNYP